MRKLKPKAAILCDSAENIQNVFGQGRLEKLKSLVNLFPKIISGKDFDKYKNSIKEIEYIFSTWGMPQLKDSQIAKLSRLKAVFYAAGSVKYFAEPYLKRGIKVISAWAENAKPTAAFALGQVLLSCKGYFRHAREYRIKKSGIWSITKDGFYECKVGIIGAGKVGRRLIELLKPFGCEILVSDPYLNAREATLLGACKTSIEKIFKECRVVSNHLPDIKETKEALNSRLFSYMIKNATFINTGRGAQVNEHDLIQVLKKRKDLTALLDVTYPEPPKKNSALFKLANVILSPHIAGAYGKEQVLLADCVIDEFKAFIKGKKLKYEVQLEMLKKMG